MLKSTNNKNNKKVSVTIFQTKHRYRMGRISKYYKGLLVSICKKKFGSVFFLPSSLSYRYPFGSYFDESNCHLLVWGACSRGQLEKGWNKVKVYRGFTESLLKLWIMAKLPISFPFSIYCTNSINFMKLYPAMVT